MERINLTEKMRKRDAAANAALSLAFAANAASSPEAFLRSGHIEGPGFQLMSRMMRKRKEADRNLDSERVSEPARNKKERPKMKTFEEFMSEKTGMMTGAVDEAFKQMPGELMNRQIQKLERSKLDLRKGRQTEKKRYKEIDYEKQMKRIQLAGKQDYNSKGESYSKFYQDPLKTGKIRDHRFR